jgi:gliding motility-associated-like protein
MQQSASGTINLTRNTDLYIGADPHNLIEYMQGKLDEICIYNRALTDSEIACLYHYQACPIVDTVEICKGESVTLPNGQTYSKDTLVYGVLYSSHLCDSLTAWQVIVTESAENCPCNSVLTTVKFKPNATIGQDAWISTSYGCIMYGAGETQPNETLNKGNDPEFFISDWTFNGNGCPHGTHRSLLKFAELSTIPTNATIIRAELKLYGVPSSAMYGNSCYSGSGYNSYCPNTSYIQKVTSAWNEQTVTWNTQPTTTTVNQITVPQTTTQWNWNFTDSSANLIVMVQDWVSNPSQNFGVMMKLVTENYYRGVVFASSDHPNAALHPELTVTYEVQQEFKDTTIINASICEGETYSENGFNVSKSGTYTRKIQNSLGDCDSILILNLNVLPRDTFLIFAAICEGDTYSQNGFNVSDSGTYERYLQNIFGCDSLIILKLNVMKKDTFNIFASICEGETYQENGFNESDSGTYERYLQNRFGCDSLVILNLTVVKPSDTVHILASICEGETYSQNGFNETKSGTYTQNIQNYAGCDSVVVLDLTVNPKPEVEIVAISDNFCTKDYIELQIVTNADSFIWNTGRTENPITITKSGTYSATAYLGNCKKTAYYILDECPCELWLPNIFSPNNDGLNDIFVPVVHSNLTNFTMTIYDRWGQIIYVTHSLIGWDGTANGRHAAAGVYYCIVSYSCAHDPTKALTKHGSVTLVR